MNDTTQQEWLLEDGTTAERLDRVLARLQTDLSRSRLQALIRDGRVAVDDVPILDPNRKFGSTTSTSVAWTRTSVPLLRLSVSREAKLHLGRDSSCDRVTRWRRLHVAQAPPPLNCVA